MTPAMRNCNEVLRVLEEAIAAEAVEGYPEAAAEVAVASPFAHLWWGGKTSMRGSYIG